MASEAIDNAIEAPDRTSSTYTVAPASVAPAPDRARSTHTVALASVALALLLGALAAAELLGSSAASSQLIAWLSVGLAVLLAVALVCSLSRTLTYRARLAELTSAAEVSACIDPLTGLLNRDTLDEHLVRAAAQARRRVEPLSALVVDLCRLGEINDRFGHATGDQVLRAFADCMRDTLRADDVFGRLEEDEFLILLPGTIRVQAELVAERLSTRAAHIELPGAGASKGVGLYAGCATGIQVTADGLMEAAQADLRRVHAPPRKTPGSAD